MKRKSIKHHNNFIKNYATNSITKSDSTNSTYNSGFINEIKEALDEKKFLKHLKNFNLKTNKGSSIKQNEIHINHKNNSI